MWSYPTYPPPIQSELFYTALEKCRAQSQKMLGAFKPPRHPKRPCGMRAYETPAWSHQLGSFSSGLMPIARTKEAIELRRLIRALGGKSR